MEIVHARIVPESKTTGINLVELGIIHKFEKSEFIIGKKPNLDDNEFYISLKKEVFKSSNIKEGDYIYIPNSEYSGIVKIIDHSDNEIVTISGPNLRLLLQNYVIFPRWNNSYNSRDDYLVIDNLDANDGIKTLCSNVYYTSIFNLFDFETKPTNAKMNCKARYEYLFEKINAELDKINMRLKISHRYVEAGKNFLIEAVPKRKLDDVYNQDVNVEINSKIDNVNKKDTILALGKGNLHERQVVVLKYDIYGNREVIVNPKNDEIGTIDSATYIYDYSSCESEEDLIVKADEDYIKNCRGTSEISLSFTSDKEIKELGTIVSGIDEITGLAITTEITQIKLTYENGMKKIEYKVGD